MKTALDRYFSEEYPDLYRDRHGDPKKTAMCWGFDIGDGWFTILDELSAALTALPDDIVAFQVKEKFGTLRFYTASSSPEADRLIDEAEKRSAVTCDICGRPGTLCGEVWLATRCERHDPANDSSASETPEPS